MFQEGQKIVCITKQFAGMPNAPQFNERVTVKSLSIFFNDAIQLEEYPNTKVGKQNFWNINFVSEEEFISMVILEKIITEIQVEEFLLSTPKINETRNK